MEFAVGAGGFEGEVDFVGDTRGFAGDAFDFLNRSWVGLCGGRVEVARD